eukprot:g33157.t1
MIARPACTISLCPASPASAPSNAASPFCTSSQLATIFSSILFVHRYDSNISVARREFNDERASRLRPKLKHIHWPLGTCQTAFSVRIGNVTVSHMVLRVLLGDQDDTSEARNIRRKVPKKLHCNLPNETSTSLQSPNETNVGKGPGKVNLKILYLLKTYTALTDAGQPVPELLQVYVRKTLDQIAYCWLTFLMVAMALSFSSSG